ncbi:MAG TPA: ABATE domain-containing protein, partial [Candidatus Dormibacteraeota bacterium]|nr:ABATE domain-containing protein [Candidatus Dormibacteraeota bacterium]
MLDLVNTLDHRFRDDPPVELLPDYEALLSFARQSGILDAGQVRVLRSSVKPQAAARALGSARELREALATVFYGNLEDRPPPAGALRTL